MSDILAKSAAAFVPASLLFLGSVVLFRKERSAWSLLQVLGSGCIVVVVLTHVSEALQLFPWMRWGLENSPGHYLDLSNAVLGFTFFPMGYLLYALAKRHVAERGE